MLKTQTVKHVLNLLTHFTHRTKKVAFYSIFDINYDISFYNVIYPVICIINMLMINGHFTAVYVYKAAIYIYHYIKINSFI